MCPQCAPATVCPHRMLPADRLLPSSRNTVNAGRWGRSPAYEGQLKSVQVWLGPALAGRQVTIWADATVLHVLLGGTRLKTLSSRLGPVELARLAADGAPPPSGPVSVQRRVSSRGSIM